MIFSRLRRKREPKFTRPVGIRDLTIEELQWIGRHGTCPFCHGDLYEGPQGGMCTNLLCKADGCWSRFNYCYYVGQYMGQDKQGF